MKFQEFPVTEIVDITKKAIMTLVFGSLFNTIVIFINVLKKVFVISWIIITSIDLANSILYLKGCHRAQNQFVGHEGSSGHYYTVFVITCT